MSFTSTCVSDESLAPKLPRALKSLNLISKLIEPLYRRGIATSFLWFHGTWLVAEKDVFDQWARGEACFASAELSDGARSLSMVSTWRAVVSTSSETAALLFPELATTTLIKARSAGWGISAWPVTLITNGLIFAGE